MSKRTREQVRKAILQALADGKRHRYGFLERKVDTSWITVRDHCKELALFKAVTISEKGVRITRLGHEILKRI